jgi:hypothetical protein
VLYQLSYSRVVRSDQTPDQVEARGIEPLTS